MQAESLEELSNTYRDGLCLAQRKGRGLLARKRDREDRVIQSAWEAGRRKAAPQAATQDAGRKTCTG